jgi:hypothetical protein
MLGTNRLARELDALEAEVQLTLSDNLIPDERRRDIEKRVAAIRQKAGGDIPAT